MASKTATTAETEEPREETPDGPLIDASNQAIKKMVAKAKERGYITYDELNEALPQEQVSSEQIEDFMTLLSEMGVNVIESDEGEDSNPEAASDTAHMVNILPQTRILNRGAWGETEEIAECAREQQSILVIGGVIWGDDDSDDYWISTDDHGLRTPDGYWKALIRGSHAIAWLFDNSHDPAVAGTDALDSRIRTLEQIAEVALLPIEFPAALMTEQSNPDAWRNDCSAAVLS